MCECTCFRDTSQQCFNWKRWSDSRHLHIYKKILHINGSMNGISETNEATFASRHIGETNSHFVPGFCSQRHTEIIGIYRKYQLLELASKWCGIFDSCPMCWNQWSMIPGEKLSWWTWSTRFSFERQQSSAATNNFSWELILELAFCAHYYYQQLNIRQFWINLHRLRPEINGHSSFIYFPLHIRGWTTRSSEFENRFICLCLLALRRGCLKYLPQFNCFYRYNALHSCSSRRDSHA